jgi:hypothetical protein
MKKNRYYHLSYCSVCTNRTSNLQNGIICNLTNKQADFSDSCPNYILDKEKKEKITQDISIELKKKFDSNILTKVIGNNEQYKELKLSSSPKFRSKKDTHGLKIGASKLSTFIIIGGSLFFLIMLISNKNVDTFKGLGLAILIFCIASFLYGIKLLFDKKIYLTTSDKLMKLNKYSIAWNDVLTLGLSHRHTGKGHQSRKMVIGTKSRGLIISNIDNIDISAQEIADLIFLNQK